MAKDPLVDRIAVWVGHVLLAIVTFLAVQIYFYVTDLNAQAARSDARISVLEKLVDGLMFDQGGPPKRR